LFFMSLFGVSRPEHTPFPYDPAGSVSPRHLSPSWRADASLDRPATRSREGGSAPSACARAPWAPFAGSSPSLRRPSRCHHPSQPHKDTHNTARRAATLPGIVRRGAPTFFSGMLAQVPVGTRVRRHAPLRLSGGTRQRASSRLRSVAAHASRYRGTLLHLGGSAPPIPLGGLRPPLLALRAITSLLWRLCLQTSAALRRRASEWLSQRHPFFTPHFHGPPREGGR
jgi:hypothetical protein